MAGVVGLNSTIYGQTEKRIDKNTLTPHPQEKRKKKKHTPKHTPETDVYGLFAEVPLDQCTSSCTCLVNTRMATIKNL